MNTPYLFLGLGNPGANYARTRHNAGWLVLDALIQLWADSSIPPIWKTEKKLQAEVTKLSHQSHHIMCIKPQTFMNESGIAAAASVKWFLEADPTEENGEYPELVVFHDDLDLPLGSYKLQYASGPKVHNGVNSVRSHLHSSSFWVARIGVDTRQGDRSMPGQAYVLQQLTDTELQMLKRTATTLAEELPYTVLQ